MRSSNTSTVRAVSLALRVRMMAHHVLTILAISRDLTIFKNLTAKFSNQFSTFQIESLHLKSNQQNSSNRNLNPSCNWDVTITDNLQKCGNTHLHSGGCPVIPFTSGLSPASEDIPLPQIIS